MSTITAARMGGLLCISADTLTTFGDTRLGSSYERWHDKILRYGDSYLGIVGSAAHQLVMEHLLREGKKRYDFRDRLSIFESFLEIHSRLKERYFLNPKDEEDDEYESSRIDLLLANPHGLFGIFALREVFEFERFWAVGSGGDFALGAMHAVYPEAESAETVVRAGLAAGTAFDTGSGLPETLYTIPLKAGHAR